MRPAKSEVVNVELVDEIQVHEHAEGGLQIIIRIFPAASYSKKCRTGETDSYAFCKFNMSSRIFGMFFIFVVCPYESINNLCILQCVNTYVLPECWIWLHIFPHSHESNNNMCILQVQYVNTDFQNVWYGA